MGFLMHFRPFSAKKISDFSYFFPISPLFQIFFSQIFFDNLFNIGFLPLPGPPYNSPIPHGSPIVISIKNKEKIRFPMPTPENGFQILNLLSTPQKT